MPVLQALTKWRRLARLVNPRRDLADELKEAILQRKPIDDTNAIIERGAPVDYVYKVGHPNVAADVIDS